MSKLSTASPLAPNAVLMRASQIACWASISKSTWYSWVAAGRVPPGIKLSPGTVVWNVEEVAAALTNQEAR